MVSNVTKSITTNPLFAVVVGLLVLLVILGIIRMVQPNFSMEPNIRLIWFNWWKS